MTDYTGPSSSPYQPGPRQSRPGQAGSGQAGSSRSGGSTTDVARDQAAAVGQSASDAGSRVTQTAADQAREVAAETARQARDLLGEAGGHARGQASQQQHKAAGQLHSMADELRNMADKGGQSGVATEVAQQAAERLHGAASWLEQREPADVLQAVRDFARRRPGMFLAGAVAAGLAAGRLTRGITDAARSGDQGSGRQGSGYPDYGTQGYGYDYGTRRPPREVPPGAAIPPPPGPGLAAPTAGYPTDPGYPADTVPESTTGTVTPHAVGDEPYYPSAGVPGPGAAGPGATGRGVSAPAEDTAERIYRPGQQP
jgi:hypothetical protein